MESFLNKTVKIVTTDGRVLFGILDSISDDAVTIRFTRKEGSCLIRKELITRIQNHG